MRCSQELIWLSQRVPFIGHNGFRTALSRAYGDSASAGGPSSSGDPGAEPVFAACVLQRLPLVRPQAPPAHEQYLVLSRQRALEAGELKDYPEVSVAGKDEGASSKQQQQDLVTFNPVPTTTAADASGDIRTMRRRLQESLYLVTRSQASPGPGADAAAGAAAASDGSRNGGGRDGGWAFPFTANSGEESISDTAQRALFSTIGRTHPVFFVGRAPMAHLHAQPNGKTFFMLAQAVDDPWDMRAPAGIEYAWLTKSELVDGAYLADPRLRELVRKML